MQTLVAATIVIVLAMMALAIGVFFGRSELKGSCGGLACNGACGGCKNKDSL